MQSHLAQALVFVPTYSPEAMAVAGRSVAGVPPLVRSLMTLQLAGLENIVLLVAPDQKERVVQFLERYPERKLPQYTILCYDEPYCVSSPVLTQLEMLMAPQFLLMDTNLLFNAALAQNMLKAPVSNTELVELMDGVISLPCYTATSAIFPELQKIVAQGVLSIEGCLRHLREHFKRKPLSNESAYSTFLLKRLNDIEVAEKFLCENLRLSTHGIVAKHFNKRISLPMSLFFSKIWMKPNVITSLNLFIGVMSGVFVANGRDPFAMLFGAFLFQLASVIDGCDGEVAKLTFRFSKYGGHFDTIVDYISLFAFIIGLIIGHWNATHSAWSFVISGNLLLWVSAFLGLVIWVVRNNSRSASLIAFEQDFIDKLPSTYPAWVFWMLRTGKFFIKKDFFSLVAFVLALFGELFWWLYAANIMTMIGFFLVAYLVYREIGVAKRV